MAGLFLFASVKVCVASCGGPVLQLESTLQLLLRLELRGSSVAGYFVLPLFSLKFWKLELLKARWD